MAWSDSRTRALRIRFDELLTKSQCTVHHHTVDVDANMSFIAISGTILHIQHAIEELWDYAKGVIDLKRHGTQYERLGALAELDWMNIDPTVFQELQDWAVELLGRDHVPVIPTDLCPSALLDSRVAKLRANGFGTLSAQPIADALGCSLAHERLGATVLSINPFRLRVTFSMPHFGGATLPPLVDRLRMEGDVRFRGVRAAYVRGAESDKAFVTFDSPDEVDLDPALKCLHESLQILDHPQILGAIRSSDRLGAQRAFWSDRQVMD